MVALGCIGLFGKVCFAVPVIGYFIFETLIVIVTQLLTFGLTVLGIASVKKVVKYYTTKDFNERQASILCAILFIVGIIINTYILPRFSTEMP